MPRPSPSSRLPAWLLGSGVIAVAMGVMNLGTYGFTIIAARLLGPDQYGGLAAVMGLLLVLNVVSLGLQATGARRVSAAPTARADVEAELLAAGRRAALLLGLLALLAAPLVTRLLRLESPLTAVLMAVAAVPLTLMGAQAGVLQGARQWLPLAGIYTAVGLGRVGCGAVAMLLQPTALSAMVGVAVGGLAPAVVGGLALRRGRDRSGRPRWLRRHGQGAPSGRRTSGWAPGGALRELGHNGHALLAFFALSNADVVIARSVLPDREAGLYAAGLILAKAVLFLPQFVVVVAFPTMAEQGARRSLHLPGLGLVLLIGAAATAAAWQLPGLALAFVGGAQYADVAPLLWAFAGVGTVLALTQMLVYGVVARQSQRAVYAVWAGLVVLLLLAPVVGSVGFLVAAVAATEAAVLLVLLLRGLAR